MFHRNERFAANGKFFHECGVIRNQQPVILPLLNVILGACVQIHFLSLISYMSSNSSVYPITYICISPDVPDTRFRSIVCNNKTPGF